ncbi:MAG TPA: hypothetical protein VHD85_05335, partial [Terracidiphilus sp.]|nr:hypothetical protein [Terracidiphilus sp.]
IVFHALDLTLESSGLRPIRRCLVRLGAAVRIATLAASEQHQIALFIAMEEMNVSSATAEH